MNYEETGVTQYNANSNRERLVVTEKGEVIVLSTREFGKNEWETKYLDLFYLTQRLDRLSKEENIIVISEEDKRKERLSKEYISKMFYEEPLFSLNFDYGLYLDWLTQRGDYKNKSLSGIDSIFTRERIPFENIEQEKKYVQQTTKQILAKREEWRWGGVCTYTNDKGEKGSAPFLYNENTGQPFYFNPYMSDKDKQTLINHYTKNDREDFDIVRHKLKREQETTDIKEKTDWVVFFLNTEEKIEQSELDSIMSLINQEFSNLTFALPHPPVSLFSLKHLPTTLNSKPFIGERKRFKDISIFREHQNWMRLDGHLHGAEESPRPEEIVSFVENNYRRKIGAIGESKHHPMTAYLDALFLKRKVDTLDKQISEFCETFKISPERVILVGDQWDGGSLALSLASISKHNFAGVLAIEGFLPFFLLPERKRKLFKFNTQNKDTKFLISYSKTKNDNEMFFPKLLVPYSEKKLKEVFGPAKEQNIRLVETISDSSFDPRDLKDFLKEAGCTQRQTSASLLKTNRKTYALMFILPILVVLGTVILITIIDFFRKNIRFLVKDYLKREANLNEEE